MDFLLSWDRIGEYKVRGMDLQILCSDRAGEKEKQQSPSG